MKEPGLDRRTFLRNAGRKLILLGLGLLGGSLLAGNRIAFKTRQECINRFICRSCSIYRDCILPQALSAKEAGLYG